MKIRSGFVSNSSSSSYVIVIEKEAFDQMYAQLTEIQKDIVAFLLDGAKPLDFGNMQVVVIQYVSGNYSTFDNYGIGDGKVLSDAALKELEVDHFSCGDEWESISCAIAQIPKNKIIRASAEI